MKKRVKIIATFTAVICIVLLIILVISGVFFIKYFSSVLDNNISAKEGYNIAMGFDKCRQYRNNITQISSEGLSKDGKANRWFFLFTMVETGSNNSFSVYIDKDRTYPPSYNFTKYPNDTYITNWEIDSTEIMKKAEKLDCVKDFYKDNKLSLPGPGQMIFRSNDDDGGRGCEVTLNYHAGGGLIFEYHEMCLFFDGTTGEFIEVVYYYN